jgi:hypothetical protein
MFGFPQMGRKKRSEDRLNAVAFSSPNEGAQLQAFFDEDANCECHLWHRRTMKGAKRR